MRSVFVTGTDTGIGKTVVAAGMAAAIARRGVDVGVMKPVATGGRRQGPRVMSDDALFLKSASGARDPLALINPVAFEAPLAPNLAARVARRTVDLPRIWKAYRLLSRLHPAVVVEGVGGLMVPLQDRYFVADLVQRLKLPLIVVARPTLGTINHTTLTVMAARAYGIEVVGLVINSTEKSRHGVVERLAADALEQATNVPVLAEVPFLEDPSPSNLPLDLFDPVVDRL